MAELKVIISTRLNMSFTRLNMGWLHLSNRLGVWERRLCNHHYTLESALSNNSTQSFSFSGFTSHPLVFLPHCCLRSSSLPFLVWWIFQTYFRKWKLPDEISYPFYPCSPLSIPPTKSPLSSILIIIRPFALLNHFFCFPDLSDTDNPITHLCPFPVESIFSFTNGGVTMKSIEKFPLNRKLFPFFSNQYF